MAERVMLATIDFKEKDAWPAEDMAEELKELAVSCGGEVVQEMICMCRKPTANFLIGEGKVKEIAGLCLEHHIDTVIFSRDLKGSQQRNLEEVLKVKTIDRTQLILDIFARRAKSQEGKMQVELAQSEYLLPRLTGKGVMLSQLGGGIGTVGPGETKLEIDRRRIAERITRLRHELQEISADRKLKRKKRKEKHIPTISLVGYTNAGKSTLLNTLTEANQQTHDGLFTTLDPLSRQYTLPDNRKIVFSDTVGFMHKLPHHLIEAFKATLEEVVESDLLIHVLDVSNPRLRQLNESVISVLRELNADQKPVIAALNKMDKLDDEILLKHIQESFPNAVCICALTGKNIPLLVQRISELLVSDIIEIDVKIPIHRMDLVNLVHKEGQVHSAEYSPDSVHIQASVPAKIAGKIQKI